MPGTNSFYPYGESSTNILNNSEYQTDSERSSGAQSGAIARSKMYNKQARQAAAGAYAVGALVAKSGKNADDSSAVTLATNFQAAVSYQSAHFVASAAEISGSTVTATVAELATTAEDDLPALFALSLSLSGPLPAGASVAIASSLPSVTLSWPIYVGGTALESDTITGGAITLLIDTVTGRAFFKAGGGSKIPDTLPPLNPNFTLERTGGSITVKADKLLVGSDTASLAGGVWVAKSTGIPQNPKDGTVKEWARADLITTSKPYDGLYLGDVTASDAVNETIIWLPENDSGKVKLVPFIVLSVDYLGGVYVTRKYLSESMKATWGGAFYYPGNPVDTFLSSTYLNSVLDKSVSNSIMTCSVPVQSKSGSSVIENMSRKCWVLSYGELYQTSFGDGTKAPYFEAGASHRIAYVDGGTSKGIYWTRSREKGGSPYSVDVNGAMSLSSGYTASNYIRPSFVLPKDFKIQQRPDGSYTVWNEMGLMTLGDVTPSTEAKKITLQAKEAQGIKSYTYLLNSYDDVNTAILSRDTVPDSLYSKVWTDRTFADYGNSDIMNLVDSWVTSAISTTLAAVLNPIDIIYQKIQGTVTKVGGTVNKAAFLPSAFNIGGSTTLVTEGSKTEIPYFKNAANKKFSTDSGSAVTRIWTRDASKIALNVPWAVTYEDSDGSLHERIANSISGTPCGIVLISVKPDSPIRLLADGTYDLVPEDPALAQTVTTLAEGEEETPLEWTFAWDADTPCYVRQYTYNQKGQYQTMLQGAVASTEDEPIPSYSEVLSENTWAQIAEAVANNDPIVDSWQIGDTKDEVVAGETLTFAIVGKDHDDKSDGTGKAKLTFGMTQLMNNTRQMNGSNTNAGSFAGSALYAYLRDTILPGMPEELRAAIKPVNKPTSSGSQSSAIRNDSMSLWLFSEVEIFGTTNYSFGGEGFQYPYFATAANRIKRLFNGMGEVSIWWERSPYSDSSSSFCYVTASGAASYYGASRSRGVCFGFCI